MPQIDNWNPKLKTEHGDKCLLSNHALSNKRIQQACATIPAGLCGLFQLLSGNETALQKYLANLVFE